MNPKLSVIIPCYNFEKYIEESVNSVLQQIADFGVEIFIIDDCSSDNTFDIVNQKYKDQNNIKIFQSSKNQGVTRNIKQMMDKCSGEYLMTLDGDDYLVDTNYFQRAVDFLENNQKYSMFCSGYRWLNNDGTYEPAENYFVSNLSEVYFSDILKVNHITTGRIFRNYKNLIGDWIHDGLHEDWAINSEILKYGPAKCENRLVAIYRITKSGRITSLTPEQIAEKNSYTIKTIKSNIKFKTITIVDSFVYNDTIRKKLSDALNWMKEDGHDVLLVSNTSVDKEILEKVKFYLYDSRNQLFTEKYEQGANLVDFWKVFNDWFEMHDVVPVLQKHGLSVLVNLFNALVYAKAQGYTHFQRFEVDDLFGLKSREYIKNVPKMCANENKKGLFYYNEENSPPDISFHYFYCEIDSFLSKVPRISCEQDYVEYLKKYHNNKEFKIVEVFVYDNLKRNGDSEFITKPGEKNMYVDLCDTRWNTETSMSSFDAKYGKCTTKLYYVNEYDKETNVYKRGNTYILLTYSYHSDKTNRKIKLLKNNGEEFYIYHETSDAGGWMWNEVPGDTKLMSVYENEKLLYTEYASDCISYVNLKR